MNIKENHNIFAKRGLDMDDMEMCKDYNLDPNIAYTPQINQAMADIMFDKNVDNYQRYEGLSESDARAKAGRRRKRVMDEVKRLG